MPGRRGVSQVGHGVEGGWAQPRCPSPLLKALFSMGQVPTLAFARCRGRLVLVRTSGGQRLMWHPANQPLSAFPSSGRTQSLPQGMTPSTDSPCRPKTLWGHVQPAFPNPFLLKTVLPISEEAARRNSPCSSGAAGCPCPEPFRAGPGFVPVDVAPVGPRGAGWLPGQLQK